MPRKPRNTSTETEENTVSTEINELETTTGGEDIESIMAALKAEIAEKQKKVRELKGQKEPRAPREKKVREPKPGRTLEDVIAAQAASPRASAVQRFVRAAHARVAAGQPIAEAVQGVMEQYSAIVLEILSGMQETGLSGREATIKHFESNFPTVSSGRKRSRKVANEQSAPDADEADEADEFDEDSDEDEDED